MNKKLCTILFLLISSIINIVTLLATVILLILGSTSLLRYVVELPDGHQAYTLAMLVSLVLGFVLSFLLNQKLALKVINKFNLESKFEEKWLGRKGTAQKSSSYSEPAKKTNLPDSAKLSEEEELERKKWGDSL